MCNYLEEEKNKFRLVPDFFTTHKHPLQPKYSNTCSNSCDLLVDLIHRSDPAVDLPSHFHLLAIRSSSRSNVSWGYISRFILASSGEYKVITSPSG